MGVRYISRSGKKRRRLVSGECPINWTKSVLVSARSTFSFLRVHILLSLRLILFSRATDAADDGPAPLLSYLPSIEVCLHVRGAKISPLPPSPIRAAARWLLFQDTCAIRWTASLSPLRFDIWDGVSE